MGLDARKIPPLPAPTETDSTSATNTELVTDGSTITQKTSHTVPEDGSPVTITTRRVRNDRDTEGLARKGHPSQTSVLIEYFEGGKGSQADTRRPSVRVKVTPSSKNRSRSTNEHIQITESHSRKPSNTKRVNLTSLEKKDEKGLDVGGDNRSISSFASATEESNVSKAPVEVEVMPPRRHGSPLIPMGEGSSKSLQQLGSDVSSMPANSFLDGKRSPERKRSRSLTRDEAVVAGAATGLAAGAVANALKSPTRRRSRSLSRERLVAQKVVEKVKGEKSERRHKYSGGSRSRSVSNSEKHVEASIRSPRRRSSRGHAEESILSGADSSQVTASRLSGDQRSFRSGTSKSSINNPKLLETVEDAIRRLILPELTALKKEQKASANREKFERDRRGSITSGSTGVSRDLREETPIRKLSGRSSAPDVSTRSKGLDDREDRSSEKGRKERKVDRDVEHDSPRSFERGGSEETVIKGDDRLRNKRSGDKNTGFGLAAGLGLTALTASALHNQSRENLGARDNQDERQERRKRRTKSRSQSDSIAESYEENQRHQEPPPMPLMSEINPSELTRASILSAETERSHSTSAERLTPIREVNRGVASPSRTPTRSPLMQRDSTPTKRVSTPTQRGKGSQGELNREYLKSKERRAQEEYDLDQYGRKVPMRGSSRDEYHDNEALKNDSVALESGAVGAAGGALMNQRTDKQGNDYEEDDGEYYEHEEDIPSPLARYVPYNQQKRGLSPIQSVSGYTEDDGAGQQARDSRLTRSTGSYSTMDQSPQHRKSAVSENSDLSPQRENYHDFKGRQGGMVDSEINQDHDEYWDEHHMGDNMNREFDRDSYRSSDLRIDYNRMTNYTDDSLDGTFRDRVAAGQSVRGLGANPDYVHTPVAVESAVASLVSASVVTGNSESNLDRRDSYASYDDSERRFTGRGSSPQKYDKSRDMEYTGSEREYASQQNSPTKYAEYELDDHGRKVTMPKSQTKDITSQYRQDNESSRLQRDELQGIASAIPQKSYKDHALNLDPRSPRHSVDRLTEDEDDHENVLVGASGVPDLNNPMPEIGYGYEASDAGTSHSYIDDPLGGTPYKNQDHRLNRLTPPQPKLDTAAATRAQKEDSGLKEAELELPGAAAGAGATAAIVGHNRETGHDHDEQWQRNSDERKRDTLITNPYEGTSPITLLGGQQDRNLLGEMGYGGINHQYGGKIGYATGSPGGLPKDEGYISSAPNARSAGAITPDHRAKGAGFMDDVGMGAAAEAIAEDPFYTPDHARHLSRLSHGTESPLYDAAAGTAIDRIQSKDIIALMEHLTVRDAQRSARDTEILVTLVHAAAEMRNSFEDMKRLLVDTEDVIINETRRNTDISVQRVINGPRPLPANTARSIRAQQEEMIDDIPAKRRNVFRRALKGLSMKSSNDLSKIEQMLMQLLGEVEGLKVAQDINRGGQGAPYETAQQEETDDQDHGYEPEGNAGTSTASHASQSGHFSAPTPRGASAPRGFDGRKFSDNRISTVPEGDEDELNPHEQAAMSGQFEINEHLLTPTKENVRGSSAPLGTPPQQHVTSASLSNENTPKTDKSKKHKSSSSFGWNPVAKISRWSETTASTVARGFRSSGRRDTEQFEQPPSRSGSDLGNFESPKNFAGDKLHSGFSQDNIPQSAYESSQPQPTSMLPPEDPKYKAHRNSLNLQHPQPRPGPTIRYQTALESQAQEFHSPMSPKSVDWGSSTSVNRLPPNSNVNRYSNQTNGTDQMSPLSDGGYSQHSQNANNGLQAAPARPPKEPLSSPPAPERPPKIRSKLTKPSPLSNEHLNADDLERPFSNRTVSSPGYESSRTASANLGVPTRKPTGPRSMGQRSQSSNLNEVGRLVEQALGQRKRDTFGTIASNQSGESETF